MKKNIYDQNLYYKKIILYINKKIIDKLGTNKKNLIYINKSIKKELNKNYNNIIKEITKPYFYFDNLQSYLRNDLNIIEKEKIIKIIKKFKIKQRKLEIIKRKIFLLKLNTKEKEKIIKKEYIKNIDIFDNWRFHILPYIKNNKKDIYIAYENYIFHTHFGRLKAYYTKTTTWQDIAIMKDDLKERGINKNKITPKQSYYYSINNVKKHNIKTNCWTIIDGKIYNLTSFFGHHPGGSRALLDMCGKDATAPFYFIHKFQSEEVGGILKQLYIGELKK